MPVEKIPHGSPPRGGADGHSRRTAASRFVGPGLPLQACGIIHRFGSRSGIVFAIAGNLDLAFVLVQVGVLNPESTAAGSRSGNVRFSAGSPSTLE